MYRSLPTWSLRVLLLCCTAMLVGCGDKDKSGPKAKDAPGLNERPAPTGPGAGDGKKSGAPGAATNVQ